MKGLFSLLLLLVMCLRPVSGLGAMVVRDYTPSRHDRFYSGAHKHFVGGRYDFSGVGFGRASHWVTLVSDNCFLTAYHRRPSTGETVTFWSTNSLDGPSYTYTVAGGARVGRTDLWVGWFDRAVVVDVSIARYPVPVLEASKRYCGLELYNYGMKQRVGRNVLDKFDRVRIGGSSGWVIWYGYGHRDHRLVGGDETALRAGDSGAPSFAVFNSRLALIGIHWAKTLFPPGSYDTFVPEYYDQINDILAERGQSLRRSWDWK